MYQKQLLHPGAKAVLGYVRNKRGLTPETIETFQFGYAPDSWHFILQGLGALGHSEDEIIDAGLAARNENGRVYDRFRNRLMIPIRDERGRVVGFGGRALSADDPAKYINSPSTALFDKSRLLFGLDSAGRCKRRASKRLAVRSLSHIFGAIANEVRGGDCDDYQDYADYQRGQAEIVIFYTPSQERDKKAAELDAGYGDGHCKCAAAREPVVYERYEGDPAAHSGAKRDGEVCRVELPDRLNLRIEDEARAHD